MIPAIGYAIREQDGAFFDDPAINGAEIAFDGAGDRRGLDSRLHKDHFEYVSVHPVDRPLAGGESPPGDYLDALKRIAIENGARSVSDCSRPQREGRRRQTWQAARTAVADLDAACRDIDAIQSRLGETRFYLDQPLERSAPKSGTSEAEFLISVLRRTGCGWLLDVTEVYTIALNEGFDPYEFVEEVTPAAEQVQMRLSGVCFDREREQFVDSPSQPIPQPVLDLYEFALETAEERVSAVFIDRDRSQAGEEACRREVQLVREIAESVEALSCAAC